MLPFILLLFAGLEAIALIAAIVLGAVRAWHGNLAGALHAVIVALAITVALGITIALLDLLPFRAEER